MLTHTKVCFFLVHIYKIYISGVDYESFYLNLFLMFTFVQIRSMSHKRVMVEEIPPFHVKQFEYPEKHYINIANFYNYSKTSGDIKNNLSNCVAAGYIYTDRITPSKKIMFCRIS